MSINFSTINFLVPPDNIITIETNHRYWSLKVSSQLWILMRYIFYPRIWFSVPFPLPFIKRKKSAKRKYLVRAFVYEKRFWCLKVCILGVQFISSIHFALSSSSPAGYFYLFINTNLSLHYLSRRNAFSYFISLLVKRSFHYSFFRVCRDQVIYIFEKKF